MKSLFHHPVQLVNFKEKIFARVFEAVKLLPFVSGWTDFLSAEISINPDHSLLPCAGCGQEAGGRGHPAHTVRGQRRGLRGCGDVE